jgi:ribosomal protein S18 acetylase RimI-like enzyme
VADTRRLGPGDEELVRRLGEERAVSHEAARRLLADPAARFLVAFEDGEPVGFVLAYVLNRRRLPERSLFLYEIDVDERFRRRGIGKALMAAAEAEARAAGCAEGFVLTYSGNEAAMALYRSAGGLQAPEADVTMDFLYGP